jgi:hypothetical protein
MKDVADAILADILGKKSVRDPREICRKQLQNLKQDDHNAYQKALAYYEETLLPEITQNDKDCLVAWQKYGCFVANLRDPGSPVEIDTSGNLHDYNDPTPMDRMVLHIPDITSHRALPITLPLEMSEAQAATYDLLVKGAHQLNKQI